jgi:hypothetical protein
MKTAVNLSLKPLQKIHLLTKERISNPANGSWMKVLLTGKSGMSAELAVLKRSGHKINNILSRNHFKVYG